MQRFNNSTNETYTNAGPPRQFQPQQSGGYPYYPKVVETSKVFEIDISRNSQSPFIIFKGQKGHDDEEILKVQEFIETNFQEKLNVDDLCSEMALSRRIFERRFKKKVNLKHHR